MPSISMNKTKLNKKFETNVRSDVIVPDFKGDIVNIVCSYATVSANESYLTKDKITISGMVYFTTIYTSDEEKTLSLNHKMPFSHQIEIQNADDVDFSVKAYVKDVKTTFLNSRKVALDALLSLDVLVTEVIDEQLSFSDEEFLLAKTEQITSYCNVINKKEDFCVEYETELADAENLICAYSKVVSKDIKIINNKIILKGTLKINVLYELKNGEIQNKEFLNDYTEVFDVNSIMPDMKTKIDLQIRQTDANILDEEKLSITTFLSAYILSYDEYENDILTDVYSIDYETKTETKTFSYESLIESVLDKFTLSDTFDVSRNGISSIYDVLIYPDVKNCFVHDMSMIVEGEVKTEVIYYNADNVVSNKSKNIPFSYSYKLKNNHENLCSNADVFYDLINISVNALGEIELKITFEVIGDVFECKEKTAITSVSLDKSKPVDKSSIPSITVYFVQKGDTLWDIAKKYHTTIKEISKVNNIDENKILNIGERLIIPKK